jgi:hypothetical protein
MKKCSICKFPYEEFYECKLEDNYNTYDICFTCAKYEALNNKNFKWLDKNDGEHNL